MSRTITKDDYFEAIVEKRMDNPIEKTATNEPLNQLYNVVEQLNHEIYECEKEIGKWQNIKSKMWTRFEQILRLA